MSRKYWVVICVVCILAFFISVVFFLPKETKQEENGKVKIVTSFYPIYIMALNITQGAQNVELMNLTQNNVGCIHDYTLSSADMRKMEEADIFIQNGLGLENFMNKMIETYPEMKVIDSSEKVTNKIEEENVNPHIWLSMENYKKQVENITEKLCEYNAENAEIYQKNSKEYLTLLDNLQLRYHTELSNIKKQKAVCLDEALSYFTKELQMETLELVTHHEESTLSADNIKNTIQTMQTENIKIIFVGEEEGVKNAETLAKETNAKIYQLDTCLTGNLTKDAYLTSMENNLEILKKIGEEKYE